MIHPVPACRGTTQTILKWCRQLDAVTGLWERNPTVFIGMPRIMKNKLNNAQEELKAASKVRKKLLAKHMSMIWDGCVGRILDTRFEVTTKLIFSSFDMEIEIDLYDMKVVAPFSFDEDIIHDKIGTNKCNKFGISDEILFRRRGRPQQARETEKLTKPAGAARTR